MSADQLFDAWPFKAERPDRYGRKYRTYQAQGGLIDVSADVLGFTGGKHSSRDIGRFYFFCVAFDQMMKEGVRGHLAELGVYQGRTAGLLAAMARRMGTTAYLIDTYEGFDGRDLAGIDRHRRQAFQDTSLEAVRANVGDGNTCFVKGYFPEVSTKLPPDGGYCLVHIDCDLYAPISAALAYFYPRMLPGGFIIVHDYGALDWDGAERATDEFFADKPECLIPLTDRGGSVAVRKARPPGRGWLLQKCARMLATQYVSAGNGALREMLYGGWSAMQDWGVWGVGAAHEMRLVLDDRPQADVTIVFDVRALLIGTRRTQTVHVVSAGTLLAEWIFDLALNRGERDVRVPATRFTPSGQGFYAAPLDFVPQDVRPANELDSARSDTRAMGVALHGLRREISPAIAGQPAA